MLEPQKYSGKDEETFPPTPSMFNTLEENKCEYR